VANHGETGGFYAQVTMVSGSITRPSVPWPMKWRGSDEREMTIHKDSSELLEVLEVVPMGADPYGGSFEPGLMIGKSITSDIPMRIAAHDLDDIYRAELRLDLSIVNTRWSWSSPVSVVTSVLDNGCRCGSCPSVILS